MPRNPYYPRVRAYSGEYNTKVSVYSNSTSRSANTDGQRPESASLYCTRWVSVMPRSASERFLSQQTKGDVTHVVRMRYDNVTKLINSSYWITRGDGTRMDIVGGPYDVDNAREEILFDVVQRQ